MAETDYEVRKPIHNLPGDLGDILNVSHNRIHIYSSDDPVDAVFAFSAFLTGDIDISGNASWTSLFTYAPGAESGVLGYINDAISLGTNIWNSVVGLAGSNQGMSKPQFRAPITSVVDWKGSGEFALQIPLIFVALTPEDDIRLPVSQLMSFVYPHIGFNTKTDPEGSFLRNTVIRPPRDFARVPDSRMYNYSGDNFVGLPGCLGIQIGEWFVTPPMFIVDDTTFNFSKERTSAGLPLFATGTMRIKAAAQVTIEIIRNWFVGLPFETAVRDPNDPNNPGAGT